MDIRLPNLGDGVSSATVLEVMVKVGDDITVGQTLMELETDKAVAPIPSTAAGKVEAIKVKVGDKVSEGTPVITVSGAGASSGPSIQSPVAITQGPVGGTTVQSVVSVAVAPASTSGVSYVAGTGTPAPTSALISHFASQFGIDLLRIPGTGRGGRITNDDLRQYIQFLQAKAFAAPAPQAGTAAVVAGPQPLDIDFSKWGDIETVEMSGLRQKISENMAKSWNTVPHVTQFDNADITHVMGLRKKYNDKYKAKDARITVTVFAVKAIVDALKAFPNFNASYDAAKGVLIKKNYYNIGIAVDTPSGLIVPVIKDVDQKSLLQISQELEVIAQKARDRKLGVDDLRGGTFTISNLGSLGVSSFTPIVNHPEVAILGLSKGTLSPVYNDKGELEARMLMPVSLSYDHRVIDGADGARFTRHFIDAIQAFDEKLMAI